jgi:hypothetical protein
MTEQLRALALAAKNTTSWPDFQKAVELMHSKTTPDAVLALLDEIDRQKAEIADHERAYELIFRECGELRKDAEWRPIETAPKDGTRVHLYFPVFGNRPRQEFGGWDAQPHNTKPKPFWSGDGERVYGIQWYRNYPPTHWKPLPAPPDSAAKGESHE